MLVSKSFMFPNSWNESQSNTHTFNSGKEDSFHFKLNNVKMATQISDIPFKLSFIHLSSLDLWCTSGLLKDLWNSFWALLRIISQHTDTRSWHLGFLKGAKNREKDYLEEWSVAASARYQWKLAARSKLNYFQHCPSLFKGFRREFVIAGYWLHFPRSPQLWEIVRGFMGYLVQISTGGPNHRECLLYYLFNVIMSCSVICNY